MSQVISIRLPDEAAAQLRQMAQRGGRSLNELGALSIQEWLRQNEFAEIEFRPVGAGRQACLKGSLPVWQIVMVARGLDMDAARTAAYFEFPLYRIQAVLNYYGAFAQEIDNAIEDNTSQSYENLQRLLPGLNLVEINLPSKAEES